MDCKDGEDNEGNGLGKELVGFARTSPGKVLTGFIWACEGPLVVV